MATPPSHDGDPAQRALRSVRILHADDPRLALGWRAGHGEVAAEVDHRAEGAPLTQLGHDDVGGQTLAQPAAIQAEAVREAHRARPLVDGDTGHAVGVGDRRPRLAEARRSGGDEREVAVVAERHHRVAQRGVEAAVGRGPGRGAGAQQRQRVGADRDLAAPGVVQPAELARRQEPAPALLELLEPRSCEVEEMGVPDDDDVNVGAHDPEAGLAGARHRQLFFVVVTGAGGAAAGAATTAALVGPHRAGTLAAPPRARQLPGRPQTSREALGA